MAMVHSITCVFWFLTSHTLSMLSTTLSPTMYLFHHQSMTMEEPSIRNEETDLILKLL